MTPVFDTNILIDYLNGIAEARAELARYRKAAINTLTLAEVMTGSRQQEEGRLTDFLLGFEVLAFDLEVAGIAWRLRRQYRMRLPDAAIWATAKHRGTHVGPLLRGIKAPRGYDSIHSGGKPDGIECKESFDGEVDSQIVE